MPVFRKRPSLVSAEQWFPDRQVAGVQVEKGLVTMFYVTTAHGRAWVLPV